MSFAPRYRIQREVYTSHMLSTKLSIHVSAKYQAHCILFCMQLHSHKPNKIFSLAIGIIAHMSFAESNCIVCLRYKVCFCCPQVCEITVHIIQRRSFITGPSTSSFNAYDVWVSTNVLTSITTI
mmetsp:Transcript_21002/g.36125  ORF Transcript_21002/g.36125 Transcript_21002/m.36125 type:complete len:124 (+) Transcript_21002:258-629(+)